LAETESARSQTARPAAISAITAQPYMPIAQLPDRSKMMAPK